MNYSYDEVLDTLRGKVTDLPLISLWRHYPRDDLQVESLVEATLDDYQRRPSDLLKLSPHGRVPVVDFGCQIERGTEEKGASGSSSCKTCVVQGMEDWSKVDYVDPLDGEYGKQLKMIERIKDALPNTPTMMTIFSPTMVLRKLSNRMFVEHFVEALNSKEYPEFSDAIKIVEKVTTEFARASIDAGADGIFSAVQIVNRPDISDALHPHILKLLEINKRFMDEVNRKAEFSVLHLHGRDAMFKEPLEMYKPTAVNWHDKTGLPINDAAKIFKGGLLAGLEPDHVLKGAAKIDLKFLEDHRQLTKDLPFILAPGCVLWQGTSEETLNFIYNKYR